MKHPVILCLVILFLALPIQAFHAQKTAHLNFGTILAQHPDADAAAEELISYQEQLNKEGERKIVAFQEKAVRHVEKVQNGELSPLEEERQREELVQEQKLLDNLDQEIQQKISQRREELLRPIIKKVENAIKEVAQEQGYQMVFDTSTFNAILFAEDADDIAEQVKSKIGL